MSDPAYVIRRRPVVDRAREGQPATLLGLLALAAFVATVYLANWLITRYHLVPVAPGLRAPAGVFAAGAALCLRDAVQELLGYRWVLAGIAAGTALAALIAPRYAAASAIAFAVSELLDLTVYSGWRNEARREGQGWVSLRRSRSTARA